MWMYLKNKFKLTELTLFLKEFFEANDYQKLPRKWWNWLCFLAAASREREQAWESIQNTVFYTGLPA